MTEFAAQKGVPFLGVPHLGSNVKDEVAVGVDSHNVASSRGVNNDFL